MATETMIPTLSAVRDLGRAAFANGLPCVPHIDTELDAALQLLTTVGSRILFYRAWTEGWMQANLDAPVPEIG